MRISQREELRNETERCLIHLYVWLLTTKGHNMAAVFMNKFPGDSFLHNLLHLSMTQQMLDDWFIYVPQFAHVHTVCEGAFWLTVW